MATLGERILYLMKSRNMEREEFLNRTEIGEVSFERIISDYSAPADEDIIKIATVLGVPLSYIKGETDAKFMSEPITKIPIFAEFPKKVTSREDISNIKTIGHVTGNYRNEDMDLCYFVIAKDDSMIYAKIGAGDKVLINPSIPFESGTIGAVSVDGKEPEIRRIFIKGTEITIKDESLAPDIKVYDVTEHDIKILGSVVFVISYPL